MCGEKPIKLATERTKTGSPPRMRGKGQGFQVCKVARGINPACAGKSFRDNLVSRQLQDHPCVCGEKIFRLSGFTKDEGSPPRVRGKVKVGLFVGHSVRITPAYAGKSKRTDCR